MTSVLVAHPSIYFYGGAERQLSILANYLTDKNYKIVIVSHKICNEFRRSLKEARTIQVNQEEVIPFLNSIQHKFDIYNPHNEGLEMALFGRGIKTVWQSNELPYDALCGNPLSPDRIVRTKLSVDVFSVISDINKDLFKATYGADINVVVNYAGIRYDYFAEDTLCDRSKYGLKDSDFVLLQVGYYNWAKNQLKSIQSLQALLDIEPNAKLVLVGYSKNKYYEDLIQYAKQNKLSDKILFLPYLERDEDLRELYKMSDLCINPVFHQGAYATVFEAISSGLPTVVSDKFIASNLVKEHDLGIVAPIESFEEEVILAYKKVDSLREKCMKNRVWIKENLTWEKFCNKYHELFSSLVGR